MNPTIRKLWRSWWPTLLTVAVVLSFRSAVADWYDVPTGSMQPTILEGDRFLCDRTAYDWRLPLVGAVAHRADPERGDIVTFPSPVDGVRLVKRVIAVPGDVVSMRDNRLTINGEAVGYELGPDDIPWELPEADTSPHAYLREDLGGVVHDVMLTPSAKSPRSFGPIAVPEGRYLMMGDNRDNSADSRWFGFVERGVIEGRAVAIVASVDRDRWWKPRWDRFFRRLT